MQSTMQNESLYRATHKYTGYQITFGGAFLCNEKMTHVLMAVSGKLTLSSNVTWDGNTLITSDYHVSGALVLGRKSLSVATKYNLRLDQGTLPIYLYFRNSYGDGFFRADPIGPELWSALISDTTVRQINGSEDALTVDTLKRQVQMQEQHIAALEARIKENLNGYTPT